ncbi:MAG: WG repeat-containing protein [Oscillospiraceae bacterium]|jgi:hypothetical protein|nr:WG repeat-containing protein [Oscillospiraceae bacterium]
MSSRPAITYTPINGEYDFVHDFQEGLAFVRNNIEDFKVGYIDKSGEVAIPLNFYGRFERDGRTEFVHFPFFQDGLSLLIGENGMFGCIDKVGKTVIPFEYDRMELFHEELAAVKINAKWVYIDKSNNVVIKPEYDWAGSFREGLAPARLGAKFGYINKLGETVIPFEYDFQEYFPAEFSDGLAPIIQNGKKGYIDKTGAAAIPFGLEYDRIDSFYNGFASVVKGKIIPIAMRKDETIEEFEKRAHEEFRTNHKFGLINKSGEVVIPTEYERIDLDNDIIIASNLGKQHFFDRNGKELFTTDFDSIGFFSEGLAIAKTGNEYCYIDKTGAVKINLGNYFDSIRSFVNGFALVQKADMHGFIDKTGNIVVPLEYNIANPFNNNAAIVRNNDKWGILQVAN